MAIFVITLNFGIELLFDSSFYGVGATMAATHAASQTPKAVLQAASAGVAAITAPVE